MPLPVITAGRGGKARYGSRDYLITRYLTEPDIITESGRNNGVNITPVMAVRMRSGVITPGPLLRHIINMTNCVSNISAASIEGASANDTITWRVFGRVVVLGTLPFRPVHICTHKISNTKNVHKMQ